MPYKTPYFTAHFNPIEDGTRNGESSDKHHMVCLLIPAL